MWNNENIEKTIQEVEKEKICLNCKEKVKLKSDLIIFGNSKELKYYCYCINCYQYDYEEIKENK